MWKLPKRLKDPCFLYREDAEAEKRFFEDLLSQGKTKFRKRDIEGRIEMLTDRLRVIAWEENNT